MRQLFINFKVVFIDKARCFQYSSVRYAMLYPLGISPFFFIMKINKNLINAFILMSYSVVITNCSLVDRNISKMNHNDTIILASEFKGK